MFRGEYQKVDSKKKRKTANKPTTNGLCNIWHIKTTISSDISWRSSEISFKLIPVKIRCFFSIRFALLRSILFYSIWFYSLLFGFCHVFLFLLFWVWFGGLCACFAYIYKRSYSWMCETRVWICFGCYLFSFFLSCGTVARVAP